MHKSTRNSNMRRWARMTQIDVLFRGRESHYVSCMKKQYTDDTKNRNTHVSSQSHCAKSIHKSKIKMSLFCREGDLSPEKLPPSCNGRGYIVRRGSSAPLPHSPGGRLACIVSPHCCPLSAGLGYDRCCPCSRVKCTCRVTDNF